MDCSKTMKANDYQRNAGVDDYFKQTEGDRLDEIIISKSYAETISEIIDFAISIYNRKLVICAYLYDDVPDNIKEVYESSITSNTLKKTTISYGIENGTFYFKYILENVKEAQQNGFKLLIAFPQINALYDNPRLFAVFAAILPEPTRLEIKEILATYGMTEYDDFELLKRIGAKLPTDNYEFVR